MIFWTSWPIWVKISVYVAINLESKISPSECSRTNVAQLLRIYYGYDKIITAITRRLQLLGDFDSYYATFTQPSRNYYAQGVQSFRDSLPRRNESSVLLKILLSQTQTIVSCVCIVLVKVYRVVPRSELRAPENLLKWRYAPRLARVPCWLPTMGWNARISAHSKTNDVRLERAA